MNHDDHDAALMADVSVRGWPSRSDWAATLAAAHQPVDDVSWARELKRRRDFEQRMKLEVAQAAAPPPAASATSADEAMTALKEANAKLLEELAETKRKLEEARSSTVDKGNRECPSNTSAKS